MVQKTICRRVRVARAKRSKASVDGRTLPPSMRAMYDCDVFIFLATCDCEIPGRPGLDGRAREVELLTERLVRIVVVGVLAPDSPSDGGQEVLLFDLYGDAFLTRDVTEVGCSRRADGLRAGGALPTADIAAAGSALYRGRATP